MIEKPKFEFDPKDLDTVKVLFEETDEPQAMSAITGCVLDRKKAALTRKRVKIYDPRCEYDVGDIILKRYEETLRAGKTRTVKVNEDILLTVVETFRHPVLPCTMLDVAYEGGGPFKLHTEFLAKTGAKLLIPCGQSDTPVEPRYVEEAQDPRFKEHEPTPEEITEFVSRLTQEITSSALFLHWEDHWFLADRKVEINPGIIHRAEKLIKDRGVSLSTEEILYEIFSTNAEDVKYPTFAISFNHTLENFYRKKFICVSFIEWGRWNLWENIEAKKNAMHGLRERLEDLVETISGEEEILARKRERLALPFLECPDENSIRVCLTFRDVTSGTIRPVHIPAGFFGSERELPVAFGGQQFTIDYLPEIQFLMGFGHLFAGCRQGDTATLRRAADGYLLEFDPSPHGEVAGTGFHYDERRDLIISSEERRSSSFLSFELAVVTSDELHKIEPLQAEIHRRRDLYEAVAKLFHAMGDTKRSYPMHVLRLYHILDALAFVPWEKFLHLLLSYPAFYQQPEDVSEGIFRLDVTKVSFELGARPSAAVPAPGAKPVIATQPAPAAQEAPLFGLFAEKLQAALGTDSKDKRGKPPHK